MRGCREVFVGIDTAKTRNAVATAETGRQGEVRYLSEFDNTPDAVAKLVRKLGDRYETLQWASDTLLGRRGCRAKAGQLHEAPWAGHATAGRFASARSLARFGQA
jgi:hypothetical protein